MSTSVKHIHSGMRGAPTVNGTAGALIALLDTAFDTGCGVTTAVSVSVAGGVATATVPSGQSFDRDAVVLVAGATPAELNGESRVLSSSSTQVTFATTAADGAATGTITIKYAPQTSWVKAFGATNKAAYKSNHVQSSGHYLRVDDTGTTSARVRGYESMTDVDTGIGPFPTDAQASGGGYWWKSNAANTSAQKWRIFSDERYFILSIATHSTTAANLAAPPRGFGDPIVLAPGGDAWATALAVSSSSTSNIANGALDSSVPGSTNGGIYSPRSISALGSSVLQDTRAFTGSTSAYSGADNFLGALPSSVDGQVKTSQVFFRESGTVSSPRSIGPGLYYIPQAGAYGPLSDGDMLDGAGDLAGRRLMVVAGGSAFTAPSGAYLVDLTGPWR